MSISPSTDEHYGYICNDHADRAIGFHFIMLLII
jgi:hypothetical protein